MLHIQGLSKQYGSKVLFEGAEANLSHRSRVALIGPNGAGKSTLIRMILEQEHPDSGDVVRASHLSIGHLAQELPKFADHDILSEVMRLDGRRGELLEERERLERLFAENPEPDAEDLERYGRVLEEFEALDEHTLESRASAILLGMGFKMGEFRKPLSSLSGGWLMRVALSRILLMEPDLLLLDEPTNHLDLETLLWLEDFLSNYRGAMLLVSHDRDFLNRMVSEVWEISGRKLATYRGNLDQWMVQKTERMRVLEAQYESQQSRIAEIERFVERFGSKATKARQAQSRLKELDRMERIELPDAVDTVRFKFPPASHSGREVVTLKGMGVSYGPKRVLKNVDWVLRRGTRLAVVGNNGAGKTTLLKVISGDQAPTEGEAKLGHLVKVGYYAQHQAEQIDLSKSVLQELEAVAPEMPVAQVRAIAGAFLFSGDAVDKKCKILSGGEKARVALAKLLLSPSNFLILDEPTNHLDLESKSMLLDALNRYDGTLVIVSHDRDFVGGLVDRVLDVVPAPDGSGSKLVETLGSYADYLERKTREIREAAQKSRSKGGGQAGPGGASGSGAEGEAPRSAPSNNQIRTWERTVEKLIGEIGKLEGKVAEQAKVLENPEIYTDKVKSMELIELQRKTQRELEDKVTEWERISAQLEALPKGRS